MADQNLEAASNGLRRRAAGEMPPDTMNNGAVGAPTSPQVWRFRDQEIPGEPPGAAPQSTPGAETLRAPNAPALEAPPGAQPLAASGNAMEAPTSPQVWRFRDQEIPGEPLRAAPQSTPGADPTLRAPNAPALEAPPGAQPLTATGGAMEAPTSPQVWRFRDQELPGEPLRASSGVPPAELPGAPLLANGSAPPPGNIPPGNPGSAPQLLETPGVTTQAVPDPVMNTRQIAPDPTLRAPGAVPPEAPGGPPPGARPGAGAPPPPGAGAGGSGAGAPPRPPGSGMGTASDSFGPGLPDGETLGPEMSKSRSVGPSLRTYTPAEDVAFKERGAMNYEGLGLRLSKAARLAGNIALPIQAGMQINDAYHQSQVLPEIGDKIGLAGEHSARFAGATATGMLMGSAGAQAGMALGGPVGSAVGGIAGGLVGGIGGYYIPDTVKKITDWAGLTQKSDLLPSHKAEQIIAEQKTTATPPPGSMMEVPDRDAKVAANQRELRSDEFQKDLAVAGSKDSEPSLREQRTITDPITGVWQGNSSDGGMDVFYRNGQSKHYAPGQDMPEDVRQHFAWNDQREAAEMAQLRQESGLPPETGQRASSPRAPSGFVGKYQHSDLFEKALELEGITGDKADHARSIYGQESRSGKNTATSNAGARGGMQILPGTFKDVAGKDLTDINDPLQNARAGIRYASQGYDAANGDRALAGAHYYGGPGGMAKAQRGIAVSDSRNPNAPNTLEYGQQVSGGARSGDVNGGRGAYIVNGMDPQDGGSASYANDGLRGDPRGIQKLSGMNSTWQGADGRVRNDAGVEIISSGEYNSGFAPRSFKQAMSLREADNHSRATDIAERQANAHIESNKLQREMQQQLMKNKLDDTATDNERQAAKQKDVDQAALSSHLEKTMVDPVTGKPDMARVSEASRMFHDAVGQSIDDLTGQYPEGSKGYDAAQKMIKALKTKGVGAFDDSDRERLTSQFLTMERMRQAHSPLFPGGGDFVQSPRLSDYEMDKDANGAPKVDKHWFGSDTIHTKGGGSARANDLKYNELGNMLGLNMLKKPTTVFNSGLNGLRGN